MVKILLKGHKKPNVIKKKKDKNAVQFPKRTHYMTVCILNIIAGRQLHHTYSLQYYYLITMTKKVKSILSIRKLFTSIQCRFCSSEN